MCRDNVDNTVQNAVSDGNPMQHQLNEAQLQVAVFALFLNE